MEYLTPYEFYPGMYKALFQGVGSLVAGAIGVYLALRFKNLATRADADFMRQQLEVNTRLTREVEQKLSQQDYLMKRELEFRERQLSLLYGPVYGYLKSQKHIFDLWMGGKLQDQNFAVKQLFSSQDEEVRKIILQNIHLIDDTKMEDYITNFFTSSIIFGWYAASSADGQVPSQLSEHENVRYPEKFDEHFIQTTERLKARVQTLHHKFAMPLDQITKK